eukprot:CAMPEP_0171154498 /NCGR_PEP_ID=MMETSP0790-20130122/353_1 /TAXON_ID=2925 /ORGANISM="Alexandrium catenella, Strain OF101" /LENGTH=85 /DNA_ID=CAMNT_0011618563 /DNA_START=59 /DNA_END=316 /DNA_ORIENTATION=-
MEVEDGVVVLQQKEPVAKAPVPKVAATADVALSDDDRAAKERKAFERFELLSVYNYGTKRLAVEGLSSQVVYPDLVIGCEPLDEE